jgi:hypothetical protein
MYQYVQQASVVHVSGQNPAAELRVWQPVQLYHDHCNTTSFACVESTQSMHCVAILCLEGLGVRTKGFGLPIQGILVLHFLA